MADVLFVGLILAIFAVAWLFVAACDRIIGPDLTVASDTDATDVDELRRAA